MTRCAGYARRKTRPEYNKQPLDAADDLLHHDPVRWGTPSDVSHGHWVLVHPAQTWARALAADQPPSACTLCVQSCSPTHGVSFPSTQPQHNKPSQQRPLADPHISQSCPQDGLATAAQARSSRHPALTANCCYHHGWWPSRAGRRCRAGPGGARMQAVDVSKTHSCIKPSAAIRNQTLCQAISIEDCVWARPCGMTGAPRCRAAL